VKLPMNPFEQGQMARHDGQPMSINPFSMFSNARAYDDWNRGWQTGGWELERTLPMLLSPADKAQLRTMPDDELLVVQRLFTKMSQHPMQVTDQPGRLAEIAKEATVILGERS